MLEIKIFGLLAFTSFFTLINPLGVTPIFMTMTAELDQQHRVATARKATLVSFVTIILFSFSGHLLFNFFLGFQLIAFELQVA